MIMLFDNPPIRPPEMAFKNKARLQNPIAPKKPDGAEICVRPGQLVQVLNLEGRAGAIPPTYISSGYYYPPRTAQINCQAPHLDAAEVAVVGQLMDGWMRGVRGFSTNDILQASGLLEIAHKPVDSLAAAQLLRLQTLKAVLSGYEVVVFDSPWAQEDMDWFIVNLLRFLRQHEAESGLLPAFVVRDAGNLPAITMLANKIWEIKKGQAVELEMEAAGL
jgi:hypothetical protein